MLFITPNSTVPDETSNTLWKVTARVWIDTVDLAGSGKLSFQAIVNNGSKYFISKFLSHKHLVTGSEYGVDIELSIPVSVKIYTLYFYPGRF